MKLTNKKQNNFIICTLLGLKNGKKYSKNFKIIIFQSLFAFLDFVSVNDSILVQIQTIELVTSLTWNVSHNKTLQSLGNVSVASTNTSIQFLASKVGKFFCTFVVERIANVY